MTPEQLLWVMELFTKGNKMEMMTMGVIHLSKLNEHADKLKRILREHELIDEYQADEMALEAPFLGKMYNLCSN